MYPALCGDLNEKMKQLKLDIELEMFMFELAKLKS